MKHNLYRLSAFPKNNQGGNPAGVVLNADLLSEFQMQEIAKDVNYSETAFVMKSHIADFKVRFFTPTNEVDLCGHATIATFNLMRDLGIIKEGMYRQETKAGVLNLDVRSDFVYMQQNKPLYEGILNSAEIENCFNNKDFLSEDIPISIISTGLREIFLPVKSEELLNNLKPNLKDITEVSKRFNVIGIHAFTVVKSDVYAYGRNFAPAVGIGEESATGTSNGALSCYLNKYVDGTKMEFILGQGYSMGLPSEIIGKLILSGSEIAEVWVGGSAKIL